jgi:hypothetical protein
MSSSSKLVRTVALIATGHLILPCHETLELPKKKKKKKTSHFLAGIENSNISP